MLFESLLVETQVHLSPVPGSPTGRPAAWPLGLELYRGCGAAAPRERRWGPAAVLLRSKHLVFPEVLGQVPQQMLYVTWVISLPNVKCQLLQTLSQRCEPVRAEPSPSVQGSKAVCRDPR